MITAEIIRAALQCDNPSCGCHRPNGHVHCPAHADVNTPNLSVSQGNGKPLVKCFAGCEQDRVIEELKARNLWPSRNGNGASGLTLADLSAAKRVPVESLNKWGVRDTNYKEKPAVHIPYRDLEGKITSRFRLSLTQEPRLLWKKGSKTLLYGLWHLPVIRKLGWVLLVEGESDCWTCWLNNIPALGIPGKTNWKPNWAAHLKNLKVYLWQEPDAPELPGKVARDIPGLLVIKAPEGSKDISEAHLKGLDVETLITELKAQAQAQEPAGETAAAPATRGFTLSDLGNARRLVAMHGQDLRYCHLSSRWWIWTGQVWQEDHSGVAPSLAKQTVGTIYAEAAAAGEDFRKALASFALRSERTARIAGMISLAESEPGIPVRPDQLDTNPWLLNCLSGALDLKTGELRPHARGDLITKLAPVEFDPKATCPLFLKFLDRIMGGNAGLINFLQKILGYSLTGSTREQCLFFLYGLGANGKSTLLEIVQSLWGDYATRTSSETFLAKKPGGIPNDVAALRGARLAAAVEVEQGRRLAEVLVKEMTGGDTISARFMRAEWFSFKPQFKIFLATNHKPVIRGTDHAIWRRIRLIPFTVQIPKEEQDRDLPEKLRGELPGILNWALAGCLQWRFGGLEPPKEVEAATQDYRSEMDVLADFLAECCLVAPAASATAAELYKNYLAWAEDNGEKKPFSQKILGTALSERGFERSRGHGGKTVWKGIGVKD